MKRKVLSLMLGLCMVLGMMASASAADTAKHEGGSVTGNEVPDFEDVYDVYDDYDDYEDDDVIPSTDVTATPVQDVSKLPAAEAAVLTAATEAISSAKSTSEFIANAGLASAVQNVLASAAAPISMDQLEVAATFSVSSAGAASKAIAEGRTVELSFKVDGISNGDTVVVLVFDGTRWSVVPAVVRGGRVVGQFSTLGTVVVMKADEAAASDYVTSPQTSGTNLESVLICGAVLSLAVLVLCIKRSRMA